MKDTPDRNSVFAAARAALVAHLRNEADWFQRPVRDAILRPGVLDAVGRIPREAFVPAECMPEAYRNEPLAIGYGQTISQPFIVALMTGLLRPVPTDRVLEIGTGSGYQAAVLSQLVAYVYSIEVVPALGAQARQTLQRLGIANVEVRIGDGHAGWPEAAPFNGVIVTAAADSCPQALIDQLAPGGRLVVPLSRKRGEMLVVYDKTADGTVTSRDILPVRFVPFVGDGGTS